MKSRVSSFAHLHVILVLLLTLGPSAVPPVAARSRTDPALALATSDPTAGTVFVENAGQFPEGARFRLRGAGLDLWLAEDALWLTVTGSAPAGDAHPPVQHERVDPQLTSMPGQGAALRLSFIGANRHPRLEPFNSLNTHISYFVGNDPAQWRADVPAWGGVCYRDLYPGIDLELTGRQGRLAPRLVADAGADLSIVRLRVEGADTVTVHGDLLHLSTPAGEATWPLLNADGQNGGAAIRLRGKRVFDISAPFAAVSARSQSDIDYPQSPVDNPADLLYGTFLGGSFTDQSSAIAVDASGAAYVTGTTYSFDLPTTPGAFDTSYNDGLHDIFVAKLNAEGTDLAYATFLGGANHNYGFGDAGYSIAVDGSGAAYVTGTTDSTDFPTTPGAFHSADHVILDDAFVVKLHPEGTALTYSTLLGTIDSFGHGITVDASGAAYVAGFTGYDGFPTTPGAFDEDYSGYYDAFVAKLNADGTDLTYATYLGGTGGDNATAIALDGSGAAYVTGYTSSEDFPTTPSAFDTSFNGDMHTVFVAKLNAEGTDLAYATFLGGAILDEGHAIAVDPIGAAYVAGFTSSFDFPTTPGAYDTSFSGSEGFVAKLNPSGSALDYATFMGGSDYGDYDRASSIALQGSGVACVAGLTQSTDFPTTPGAFDSSYNGGSQSGGDAFVAALNPTGSALIYATYLGGSGDESGVVAVDASGAAYVTGMTSSTDFPTTVGAFDTSFNGIGDAFVARLAMQPPSFDHSAYLPLVLRGH